MSELEGQINIDVAPKKHQRHHSHSKKRKSSKKVTNLRRIIIFSALACIIYFCVFFVFFAKGDYHNNDGFLKSDFNYVLSYMLVIAYIINISAVVKSFFFGKELSAKFNKYRFLSVLITLVLFLFLFLTLVNKEQHSTNEFMIEDANE